MDLFQRNDLIEAHLPRVRSLARKVRYSRPACFDVEELNSVGVLALTEIAALYDPSKGEFWPFVEPRVLGAMLNSSSGKAWREACHDELAPETVSRDADPAALAISAERCRQVRRAVETLPVRQRRVIQHVHFQGERSRDVARVLGVAESTIAGLKRQALRNLRRELVA